LKGEGGDSGGADVPEACGEHEGGASAARRRELRQGGVGGAHLAPDAEVDKRG